MLVKSVSLYFTFCFSNAGQNAERFIKTLPLYNITDKTADIDKVGENIEVSRNAHGIAIGLKGLPLDYFYENYTDPKALSNDPKVRAESITSPKGRSKGLTSQTQVKSITKNCKAVSTRYRYNT